MMVFLSSLPLVIIKSNFCFLYFTLSAMYEQGLDLEEYVLQNPLFRYILEGKELNIVPTYQHRSKRMENLRKNNDHILKKDEIGEYAVLTTFIGVSNEPFKTRVSRSDGEEINMNKIKVYKLGYGCYGGYDEALE